MKKLKDHYKTGCRLLLDNVSEFYLNWKTTGSFCIPVPNSCVYSERQMAGTKQQLECRSVVE